MSNFFSQFYLDEDRLLGSVFVRYAFESKRRHVRPSNDGADDRRRCPWGQFRDLSRNQPPDARQLYRPYVLLPLEQVGCREPLGFSFFEKQPNAFAA